MLAKGAPPTPQKIYPLFGVLSKDFSSNWVQTQIVTINCSLFEHSSRVASHFHKYKGSSKKYKGKSDLNFIKQNTIDLFNSWSSSPRTAFLKSRRVKRHPYWQNCMTNIIACRSACACNLTKNYMCMKKFTHAIISRLVSINLSGPQECNLQSRFSFKNYLK